MTSAIHVLTTGGTIDKVYSVAGDLVIGPPAVPDLLGVVATDVAFAVESVLRVDSLDMADADRAVLRERVDASDAGHILITHGTDTMTETAAYLREHLEHTDKVVVLTGAMQPAAMRASDAAFNVGAAVAALQLLSPGIHIVMSGRVFPAGSVVKDRARGVFVDQG